MNWRKWLVEMISRDRMVSSRGLWGDGMTLLASRCVMSAHYGDGKTRHEVLVSERHLDGRPRTSRYVVTIEHAEQQQPR